MNDDIFSPSQNLHYSDVITVAGCNLSQWALDFEGNYQRIAESIFKAKQAGAKLRTGCELEVCGYGCDDHFYEMDTFNHCWETLNKILASSLTNNIVCNIGMPVVHKSVSYNCFVYVLNKKILLIRPKICLANEDNYRETRYFVSWKKGKTLDNFSLPASTAEITQQDTVKFGNGIIDCCGVTIGTELCEELWVPYSTNIDMGLDGVDILCNGSGSYLEIGKYNYRMNLLSVSSQKNGGLYIYSNLNGSDGGIIHYDGGGAIFLNGQLLNQAPFCSLSEINIITASVQLQDIRSYRMGLSARSIQSSSTDQPFSLIYSHFSLLNKEMIVEPILSEPIEAQSYSPNEVIEYGLTSWLWDYLRKSKAAGFFLPLSGGSDSACVATLVSIMCERLYFEVVELNSYVIQNLENVLHCQVNSTDFPKSAKELCSKILYTCYLGTKNSSNTTRNLAQNVANHIGANHYFSSIDTIIEAFINFVSSLTGLAPSFQKFGGSKVEDLALQNLQARTRMVLSYLLASILPWIDKKPSWLLVLGTGNADEAIRGYLTKYDCSSADINPIGTLTKNQSKSFMKHVSKKYGYAYIEAILKQKPSAELRPITCGTDEHSQTDEEEMGITYNELEYFAKLRHSYRYGPVSMFNYLVKISKHLQILDIAKKVKHFFVTYSTNRHKIPVLTPSTHISPASNEAGRFDCRPILYPSLSWQFAIIQNACKSSKPKD